MTGPPGQCAGASHHDWGDMTMWNTVILDPMINSLLFIYDLLGRQLGLGGAFGLAIIVFTILIRLITLPLTVRSPQSMQKMQAMQQDGRFLQLQKKYKDTNQKLQKA